MDVHAGVVHDVFQHRRIDVAGARAHQHALKRGQAHGGIHNLAAHNRAQGRAVAQVADDELAVLRLLAQELRRLARDEAVARAVEAVAANLQARVVFIRHAVEERLLGHRLVEGRIENRDVRLGRHDRLTGLDARDVRRLMQRSERHKLLDPLHRLFRHQHGVLERLAAVEHAVAAGADLVQRSDRAVVLVRQRGEDGGNRLGVVLHVAGELDHLIGAQHSLLEVRALDADALDQALRLDGLVVHVDELELQGGRASVDDQNLHGKVSPCFL